MRIVELNFDEAADLAIQQDIRAVIDGASTLEDIIDGWVNKKGGSVAIEMPLDDDENVDPELIGVSFNCPRKKELRAFCCFARDEVSGVPVDGPCIDSFIVEKYEDTKRVELDDETLEKWFASVGFRDSNALMSSIGPRSAILPYVLFFASSTGGKVTIEPATDWSPDEFEPEELREEGHNLEELILLTGLFMEMEKPPNEGIRKMVCFDPVYCSRTADWGA